MQKKHLIIILPGIGDDIFNGLKFGAYLANRHSKVDTLFVRINIGWKTNLTTEQITKRYLEIRDHVKLLSKNAESISIFSISAGTPIAILLSFEFFDKLKSFVSYCGWVGYDKKRLALIPHEGFAELVWKANEMLSSKPKEAREIGDKTLVVTAKIDSVIPMRLQRWELAKKHIKINYFTHAFASMVGAVIHLARGSKSEITRWLIDGPSS